MTLEETILKGFALLELGGFQPGRGLRLGHYDEAATVYATVLADLTPQEVASAFEAWLKAGTRDRDGNLKDWFPNVAQLRDTVPHLADSEAEWKALQAGRGSTTALLVEKHLSRCQQDRISFGRAYREYVRRWLKLPIEIRKSVGQSAAEGRFAAIERVGLLETPLLRLEG